MENKITNLMSEEDILYHISGDIDHNNSLPLLIEAYNNYPYNGVISKQLIKALDLNDRSHEALAIARNAKEQNKSSAEWLVIFTELFVKCHSNNPDMATQVEGAKKLISLIKDVSMYSLSFFQSDELQLIFRYALEFDLFDKIVDKEYFHKHIISSPNFVPLMYQMDLVETHEDRLEVMELHRQWGGRIQQEFKPIKLKKISRTSNKKRIGILDLYNDSHIGRFILPLIVNWDNSKFELYCYKTSKADTGVLYEFVKQKADLFRSDIFDESNTKIAQIIADDGLDAVVDMGTWFFKPEIIARKPAPILINWLDYPNSSGLPFDYLMVDPYTKPKDELMLEKPLQLPSSWLVLDNRFMQGYDINPNIPQKRNGYITFGTMNSIYKFNLRTIKLWAEIMNAVPNSRFLYVRREDLPSTFKQNFIQCMSDLGVDQSRIAFRSLKNFQNPVNSLTNMPSHVMEYNSIDIAFDTIPRNGGTTTCEALWMGVPVVTLVGEAFYERLSFSSLSNVGLADFCANTFEEYKAICLKLAADIDLRSYLRNNLRAIMHKSPLGDAEQFVKGFIKKIDDVL